MIDRLFYVHPSLVKGLSYVHAFLDNLLSFARLIPMEMLNVVFFRVYDENATVATRPHYQSHKEIWDETRVVYKEKFGEGKLKNVNIIHGISEENSRGRDSRSSSDDENDCYKRSRRTPVCTLFAPQIDDDSRPISEPEPPEERTSQPIMQSTFNTSTSVESGYSF